MKEYVKKYGRNLTHEVSGANMSNNLKRVLTLLLMSDSERDARMLNLAIVGQDIKFFMEIISTRPSHHVYAFEILKCSD